MGVCEVLLGYFKAPTFRHPRPSTPLTTMQQQVHSQTHAHPPQPCLPDPPSASCVHVQVSLFSSLTSTLLQHLSSVTAPTTGPQDKAAAHTALTHTMTALTHSHLFHSQVRPRPSTSLEGEGL